MSWIVLAIISAITNSLTRILQKLLLKDDQSDPLAFSFVFQTLVAGIFLIYTVITNTLEFPNLPSMWINLVILALFYSLGNLLTFKAFKLAEASEVAIIFASSSLWSVISAVLVLGEKLSSRNLVGIALIVTSIIVVNYVKSSWKFNKGHLFALLGAVLFGSAFTNDALIINKFQSIPSYMILAFALPGFTTLAYSSKTFSKLKYFINLHTLGKLIICSSFYSLSALTIYSAYRLGGQISIISPIQQTSIILTVLFGYLFLKEQKNLLNKIIGAALAFAGVLLLI